MAVASSKITYTDKVDGSSTATSADFNEIKSTVNTNGDILDTANTDLTAITPTKETVTTTPVTISAGRASHTVFTDTDTIGSDAELTITDGTTSDDRLTIVALGDYKVTLTITGLLNEEVPVGEARSYVWNGTGWTLASGGGGGINGEIQIPQPKTWVEKWNDGGLGNVTSKLNEWGTGKYIIKLDNNTVSSTDYSTVIIEVDDTADKIASAYVGDEVTSLLFGFDPADNTFKFLSGSGSFIISISRWEQDTDNLALVTVPSDPSLIKDWVEKWDDGGAGNVTTLLNTWGSGKYLFRYLSTTSVIYQELQTSIIDVDVTQDYVQAGAYGGGSSNASWLVWDDVDNTFKFVSTVTGAYLLSMERWEDVAGADAQMNPPVDGWEQKFYDYTNTAAVVNSWGDGNYKFILRLSTNASSHTCEMNVNTEETIITGTNNSPDGGSSAAWRVIYTKSTNTFTVVAASGTYYIAEIYKFNSLVNVLHSYHPDPRSVAQKDWVEKFYDYSNTANVVNSWGDGEYLFIYRTSAGTTKFTSRIKVSTIDSTATVIQGTMSYGSNEARVIYTLATNVFSVNSTAGGPYYIAEINKYEDSQASDAPREILEDGWELVYESLTGTSTTLSITEPGEYSVEAEISTGGVLYSGKINLSAFAMTDSTTIRGTYMGSSSTDVLVIWTKATGLLSISGTTAYLRSVKRFTGLLRISAQYNVTSLSDGPNQVFAINTDAGDEAVTLPSSPSLGDLFEVWNTGTNGNYVTGLPNSITLGDGKGIRLRYVDGWKYEDVIIDTGSAVTTGTNWTHTSGTYKKWAGGDITLVLVGSVAGIVTLDALPDFVSISNVYGNASATANASLMLVVNVENDLQFRRINEADGGANGSIRITYEGRWKTGV